MTSHFGYLQMKAIEADDGAADDDADDPDRKDPTILQILT